MIRNILIVGLGGAMGAMMRYGMTLVCNAIQWPSNLGTFLVNIIGSFVMGLLIGWSEANSSQTSWLLMATVGICGGFTTFSTFSMQSVSLLQQGKYPLAVLYILGTVLVCIVMAAIGYWIIKQR